MWRSLSRRSWRAKSPALSRHWTSSFPPTEAFCLRKSFVEGYVDRENPFGFNGLGEVVYLRTYSRKINEHEKEKWHQTVERVVNGTFTLQKKWLLQNGLSWDEQSQQETAMDMYERMFTMKFLPPGRGLWAMGSPLTTERHLYAALNNCAFVSTRDIGGKSSHDPSAPFCFLMDASMLGVGVGFDTLGAGTLAVHSAMRSAAGENVFLVGDSREGWVESLKVLLNSYLHPSEDTRGALPVFDYSNIRKAGLPIKGFGGTSQGFAPLKELHESICSTLDQNAGKPITVTTIVDIMNLIGKCVVAGNVRRTAEIAFGSPYDNEYVNLKNYEVNPHRQDFGWTSNNSVFAELGMDYSKVCRQVETNGEPGFAWLENMQSFSRMSEAADHKDRRASGGNPCLEQTLESYELCCLVETFPSRHDSLESYCDTLRSAFLYAKIVTLAPTHWPETNAIMRRNRRVGTSMSGLAQFIASRGIETLRQWSLKGYSVLQEQDTQLSERFGVPESIKRTCIKPSGTVSLLAGATPGLHFPESRFYIRRMRLALTSNLLPILKTCGFHIEPAVGSESSTVVVEFPVDSGEGVRTLDEVSMWEQLGLASFLQRYWADNQVSCTVTFDPASEGPQLQHALDLHQYQLKGISFLPRQKNLSSADAPYPQMPYETISEERYQQLMSKIDMAKLRTDLQSSTMMGDTEKRTFDEVPDKFCDTSSCSLDNI